jgi:DNA-binding NarL/FixJ family response regulator
VKLIVADDHGIVREGIRWMLSDVDGVDIVAEASSGEELLDLLGSVEVDVVLLDVRMPGIGGLEALERIGGRYPDVRVVILTMHDQPAYVRRAVAAGAAGYVLKNTGRDALVTALVAVQAGGTHFPGEVVAALAGAEEPVTAIDGPSLSPREREVLQLIADGLENKQVAKTLGISEATVKGYLRNVFERLDASTRAEAVAAALRFGLID